MSLRRPRTAADPAAEPGLERTPSTCPEGHLHTPEPLGYLGWHEWAARMHRAGYRQRRCPGCDLFTIWERR